MYMNLSLQIFLVWAKVSGTAGASVRKLFGSMLTIGVD